MNLNNNTIERSYQYPISNYFNYISYLYTRGELIKVQRKKEKITEKRIPIPPLSFIRAPRISRLTRSQLLFLQ